MIPQSHGSSRSYGSSGCGRRLFRTVQPILSAAVDKHKHNADRYRKRFKAQAHAWILILHMMRGAGAAAGGGARGGSGGSGGGSLRQTHAELGANAPLRRRLGIKEWISFSQLARSSTSRAPDCFEELVVQLFNLVRSQAKSIDDDDDWDFLNKTKAIDSTFLGLSAKLSPWSVCGGHAA